MYDTKQRPEVIGLERNFCVWEAIKLLYDEMPEDSESHAINGN